MRLIKFASQGLLLQGLRLTGVATHTRAACTVAACLSLTLIDLAHGHFFECHVCLRVSLSSRVLLDRVALSVAARHFVY